MGKYFELIEDTLIWKDVGKIYHVENKRIQDPEHKVDFELIRLQRSL